MAVPVRQRPQQHRLSHSLLERHPLLILGQRLPKVASSAAHFRFFLNTHASLPCVFALTERALIARTYDILRTASLTASIRVQEVLPNTDWLQVWKVVGSRVLTMRARSAWLSIVHNLHATNDKLFRHGSAVTDRCTRCGRLGAALHRITTCGEAAKVWAWRKTRIKTVADLQNVPKDFLIRSDVPIPDKKLCNAIVWLTGHTISMLMSPSGSPDLQYVRTALRQKMATIMCWSAKRLKHKFGDTMPKLLS